MWQYDDHNYGSRRSERAGAPHQGHYSRLVPCYQHQYSLHMCLMKVNYLYILHRVTRITNMYKLRVDNQKMCKLGKLPER